MSSTTGPAVTPRELGAAVVAALGGTAIVHLGRHLPWMLAAIVGLAIGVLVLASLRSLARVRAAWGPARWRRDDEGDRGGGPRGGGG